MRILLAVLSPISAELGAAQMALNLAEALRGMEIEVVVWTPYPIPPEISWWRRVAWIRRSIADYVEKDGLFDCVDLPPVAVTRALARNCPVIARSVQPDLAYLWTEMWFAGRLRSVGVADWIATALFNFYLGILVVCGWFRARHILCLGREEFEWMKKWFPWWQGKLAMYVNAIADNEREALVEVRLNRVSSGGRGTKFLWLGRWAAQKGVDLLLDFIQNNIDARSADSVTIAGCGNGVEKHIPPELLKQGNVRIVPSYDRRDLVGLLEEHDAGLFTSRTEGGGLTLQEMLESGMRVYATNAGAVHDLRREFSELLRPFPPSGSASAMPPRTQALRAEYIKRYSWRAIAKHYLYLLRNSGGGWRERESW